MLFLTIFKSIYKLLFGSWEGPFGNLKKKWQNKTFTDLYGKKHKLLRCYDVWIFRYIITIMFPPMGVFLAKGIHGWMYILACCFLTVLFYFPGLMYAFIIMNGSSINVCKALRV